MHRPSHSLTRRRHTQEPLENPFTSLSKFFKFIVDQAEHEVKGFPRLDSKTLDQATRVIKRVVAMGSSVNQPHAHEQWERVLEERIQAINHENTASMIDTEPAQEAIRLLMKSHTTSQDLTREWSTSECSRKRESERL